MEHPELERDYDFPALQIQHAVENAVRVLFGQGNARVYAGPPVQANPPAGVQRVFVVAVPEKDGSGWWIITAYGEPILE